MKIEDIAMIAHEANRAYCESVGDATQVAWTEAEGWQKESSIAGVRFLQTNTSATPAQTHESWMQEKWDIGWRWGDFKDVERKLHPCMVSYDRLPEFQRVKDVLYAGVVRALLPYVEELK